MLHNLGQYGNLDSIAKTYASITPRTLKNVESDFENRLFYSQEVKGEHLLIRFSLIIQKSEEHYIEN